MFTGLASNSYKQQQQQQPQSQSRQPSEQPQPQGTTNSRCSSATSANCITRKSLATQAAVNVAHQCVPVSSSNFIQTPVKHVIRTPAKRDTSLGKPSFSLKTIHPNLDLTNPQHLFGFCSL
jgi:hypothetical protein